MSEQQTYIKNPEFASSFRQKIFIVLVVFTASIFILRLGYLQIIMGGTYQNKSRVQNIKQSWVEPLRGNIFDRNGKPMVSSEPSFTIALTTNDFHKARLNLLASIIQMDTSEILQIIEKQKYHSPFQPIKILRDIDFDIVSRIEEYSDMLPGVEVIVESKRLYNFVGNMSHILGYTREVTSEQLKDKKYLNMGDLIGQSGIEQSYDHLLRGQKGIKYIAIKRDGDRTIDSNNRLTEGLSEVPVNNGFDLFLTIDKSLQERAEAILKNRRGSAVAIDPQNGEVLCLVSKPDYDPRKFAGRVPADIYSALRDDPGKPLYNRAIQSIYPPGSTWKMLVGLAALQEGLINENSTIYCGGSLAFGNRSYACHGAHGQVNIHRAIQASCNVFFYNLGLKLGIEKLSAYAKQFGFGERTHIDIPHEGKGIMPTIEWLIKKYQKREWIPKGLNVNYGIGQGEISVTPLQMAVYCATLANGGTVFQPHLVRTVYNNILGKNEYVDYAQKKIKIEPRYFKAIQNGMFAVVNIPGGTAGVAKIPGVNVAGKTGTAQNPHGRDHSWFICYAPAENPKIAIAVIVENAGFGSTVAAPIARDLVAHYLGVKLYTATPSDSLETELPE